MNSIFVSPDLGTNSSGNNVSKHELEFLKLISNNTNQLGYEEISPTKYGYSADNPFLIDYFTMDMLCGLDINNIDLVHLFSGPFTNTVRYLKAKKIKVTSSVPAHNLQESINEFHNLGYEYPFRHMCDEKLWKIYNQYVREVDLVIAPSKVSEDFLKKEGVKNVVVIPYGVNIPNIDTIKPISESQFIVGNLGQIGPDKGLKYLIQSWSNLKDDSTLIFAGENSEYLESFIQKFATSGKFHLMGFVKNVSDFYNKISVYVQPSCCESWGMEVLEAMSHSRPAIVSTGTGSMDTVTDGKDGFIFEKRNVKNLSDKIQYFKDNPSEIIRMGKNAREKSKQFSWDKIKEKYIKSWNNLEI